MKNTSQQMRDLKHIWHPCTQMKNHMQIPLLEIDSAKGCYFQLKDGTQVFDAISSWWCKNLGHGNLRLKQALKVQLDKFEHVILAGTTNEIIVNLSEALAQLSPGLDKVFYANDGACAVEIALKMSFQSRLITGEPKRTRFISLANGYHGETLGALSVSDLGLYKNAFKSLLFPVNFIEDIPYVNGQAAPLWSNCQSHWESIEKQLDKEASQLTAIIVEPVVQGAGGMKIYSADFLKRLEQWAHAHEVHLIVDEIMTGMGRTGKMLASEHAHIMPDFVCLSKGLTSGFLPMSAVLTTEKIYDIFYHQDNPAHAFLHSHTFSGNPLAAAVAYETVQILQTAPMLSAVVDLGQRMQHAFCELADEFGVLHNIRSIGAIVAAELPEHWKNPNLSIDIAAEGLKENVLLRPIGHTLYWMPPFIATEEDLHFLQHATRKILISLLKRNHVRRYI